MTHKQLNKTERRLITTIYKIFRVLKLTIPEHLPLVYEGE